MNDLISPSEAADSFASIILSGRISAKMLGHARNELVASDNPLHLAIPDELSAEVWKSEFECVDIADVEVHDQMEWSVEVGDDKIFILRPSILLDAIKVLADLIVLKTELPTTAKALRFVANVGSFIAALRELVRDTNSIELKIFLALYQKDKTRQGTQLRDERLIRISMKYVLEYVRYNGFPGANAASIADGLTKLRDSNRLLTYFQITKSKTGIEQIDFQLPERFPGN
jgi:hypothetical protein